jgi:hypothetical protein
MRTPATVWVFAFLCFAAVPCMAQDDKSVYDIRPWVDGPVLGISALGASVPIFFQRELIHQHCPCDPNDVNRFDRPVIHMHSSAAAWASHFFVAGAIAVPLYADYKDVGWSRTYADDFIVYAEVLAINSSVNNLARYTVQRARPEAYRLPPDQIDTGTFLSFYSGHAASTVAALSAASMTYNYRYGPHVWPWVVTGTAGVTEAALRTMAGKHFYTDNIVGLAVGTTIGTVVPWLHHRKGPSTVLLLPSQDGAQFVWQRRF